MPHTMEELRGPDDTIIRLLYELASALTTDSEDGVVNEVKTRMEAEFPWLSQ